MLGTAHVLEACRETAPRVIIVVTTDKCYDNREWAWPYRESDALGGSDPYSASKACTELVARSWASSFLTRGGTHLATVRAGNVIGGGDWSEDRLLPDAVRAFTTGTSVRIRNPMSTRPWQHVLDPLSGYLRLAESLLNGADYTERAFNFGPPTTQSVPVRDVIETFCSSWGAPASWEVTGVGGPKEAVQLALDSSLALHRLGWRSRIDLGQALAWSASWYRAFYERASATELQQLSLRQFTDSQSSEPHFLPL